MFGRKEPSTEEIACRAHKLYVQRDGEHWKDVETLPDATGYSGCKPVGETAKTSAARYFELRYAWPE